jgi:hypothetical protein
VLTQNLRLPVTRAASELVEMNDPSLYRSLSLDAGSGGRKTYTPDLLILNKRTEIAHLVDMKRSLGSYELSRIAELKNRMLAALVVPDLLYKEHRRLCVKEVRVVILNADTSALISTAVFSRSRISIIFWRSLELARPWRICATGWERTGRQRAGRRDAALSASAGNKAGKVPTLHCGEDDIRRTDARGRARLPVSIGFARAPRAASP